MLTMSEWVEVYKPILNPKNDWGGDYSAFETFGDDLEAIRNAEANTIWTEIDGDGGCYIIAGMHWVNRIQYYITEIPWEDNEEVCVEVYKDCDCQDGSEGEEEGCQVCETSGYISIYPETREELIEIFGEEAVNG